MEVKEAASKLGDKALQFTDSPDYGSEVHALVMLANRVAEEDDVDAEEAAKLVVFSGAVLSLHDTVPGTPTYVIRKTRMVALSEATLASGIILWVYRS